MPFGRLTPGRPIGRLGISHPQGVFGVFSYYQLVMLFLNVVCLTVTLAYCFSLCTHISGSSKSPEFPTTKKSSVHFEGVLHNTSTHPSLDAHRNTIPGSKNKTRPPTCQSKVGQSEARNHAMTLPRLNVAWSLLPPDGTTDATKIKGPKLFQVFKDKKNKRHSSKTKSDSEVQVLSTRIRDDQNHQSEESITPKKKSKKGKFGRNVLERMISINKERDSGKIARKQSKKRIPDIHIEEDDSKDVELPQDYLGTRYGSTSV
jgi:hypothetical protein